MMNITVRRENQKKEWIFRYNLEVNVQIMWEKNSEVKRPGVWPNQIY